MQETKPKDMDDAEAETLRRIRREFFIDSPRGRQAMENRLAELESQGEALVRRKKLGRNDPCPCNSGKKFKKCCMGGLR